MCSHDLFPRQVITKKPTAHRHPEVQQLQKQNQPDQRQIDEQADEIPMNHVAPEYRSRKREKAHQCQESQGAE